MCVQIIHQFWFKAGIIQCCLNGLYRACTLLGRSGDMKGVSGSAITQELGQNRRATFAG